MSGDPTEVNSVKTSVVQEDMKFSSLSPSLGENYRCMLVWDTRTNKDVGWVMVRKTSMWRGR